MNTDQSHDTARTSRHRRWIHGAPVPGDDGVVSLEDLHPITPREHAVAGHVAAQVQALVDWRDRAVAAGQLNPEVDLPAGGWERDDPNNDWMDAYRRVVRGNVRTLDL